MSAAPETLSGSRRLVALARSRSPRSASPSRPASPARSLRSSARRSRRASTCAAPSRSRASLVVGIDAKSFGDLQQALALPAFLARPGRAPPSRRGRPRDRLRRPVHRADPAAPGPRALRRDRRRWRRRARHQRERRRTASTRVLGGDDNLRSIDARAAASDLRNDTSGAIASFPRAVGRLDSIAVATAERLSAPTARRTASATAGLDRLPRAARHDPHRLVLGRQARARAREHAPRPASSSWAPPRRRSATCTRRPLAASS